MLGDDGTGATQMDNQRDWQGWAALFAGLLISGAVAVLVVLGAWLKPSFVCSGSNEDTVTCAREWLGVMADWGALLGSVAAAYFVYKTIAKMNEQIVEAKRQTAFTIGDQQPSLELMANGALDAGNFEIVNWNRRPFYIVSLNWTCDLPVLFMQEVELQTATRQLVQLREDGMVLGRFVIPGWKDRNSPPPEVHAKNFVTLGAGIDEEDPEIGMVPMTLQIVGYLSGEQRELVTLTAMRPVGQVVFLDP